jgi:hypothetical protein
MSPKRVKELQLYLAFGARPARRKFHPGARTSHRGPFNRSMTFEGAAP